MYFKNMTRHRSKLVTELFFPAFYLALPWMLLLWSLLAFAFGITLYHLAHRMSMQAYAFSGFAIVALFTVVLGGAPLFFRNILDPPSFDDCEELKNELESKTSEAPRSSASTWFSFHSTTSKESSSEKGGSRVSRFFCLPEGYIDGNMCSIFQLKCDEFSLLPRRLAKVRPLMHVLFEISFRISCHRGWLRLVYSKHCLQALTKGVISSSCLIHDPGQLECFPGRVR